MEVLEFLRYLCYSILLIPVFIFLFLLGFIKVAIFCPFVFLVIAFGDTGVVIGLWPVHLIWTTYCIAKSKKFGPCMKCLLILTLPIPIVLWTIVGVVGSVIMGIFYAFIWPVMETFRAISKEGHVNKLVRCLTDGTWSNIWGACTIVRDFADFSFHSYFSVMDELLEAKGEENPIELKVLQIPGCILSGILGLVVDVPIISLIAVYKAPIMLIKGWKRLFEDLIGRSGPFLEDVCVPFAGLLILLWPFVVLLAILSGIISSFGFGGYASIISYQVGYSSYEFCSVTASIPILYAWASFSILEENSTRKGLLYVFASVSLFDEYTNDFLYLREGSCFPRWQSPSIYHIMNSFYVAARPRYRGTVDGKIPLLPLKGLHDQIDSVHAKQPPTRTPSEKMKALKAVVIWDNFFTGCEHSGKKLLRDGAIGALDMEAWQNSKNKIAEIGLPAYTFLQCFLYSIKSCSPGFLMGHRTEVTPFGSVIAQYGSGNVELTNVNRPEGRIFDWLFEPMSIMKEQIRSLHLQEKEELYLLKLALSCGDAQRLEAWENGGVPPYNDIRRAQLEGISRRLHGFCVTVSRLPTFRRRFCEVINVLLREAKHQSSGYGSDSEIEDVSHSHTLTNLCSGMSNGMRNSRVPRPTLFRVLNPLQNELINTLWLHSMSHYLLLTMDLLVQVQVIIGLFFLVLVYFQWYGPTRTKTNSKNAEAPEPAGAWPIIGHLHLLGGHDQLLYRTLGLMADKYGPAFNIRLGSRRAFVVSSWEVAKECFTINDKALATRPTTTASKLMGYNYAVFGFAPYSPFWREMRKIATLELLSNRRLEMLKHVHTLELDMGLKDLYGLWAQKNNSSGPVLVELKQWFETLTLNGVVRMVASKRYFGTSANCDENEAKRCQKAIAQFFHLIGIFMVSDALPSLWWLDLQGHRSAMKKTAKELDSILSGWLEEHRQSRLNGAVKADSQKDFIDVMLSLQEDGQLSNFQHDPDTSIKATCLALILGGSDTTAGTLTWAISLLLNNRHILEKAQEELDVHVGNERQVQDHDIKNLVYLQAIIKETLRLYPAGPLLGPREAMEDCTVAGYNVRSGTRLVVNIWKLQRDPSIWSKPNEFNPDRFLTSHVDVDLRGQNFELMPFGSGRRSCPGVSFALQVLHLTLARLLHGFKLDTPLGETVDMTESPGLTIPKATDLNVLVTPRLPSKLY
ncbi:hypothetical protein IFM89_036751 [Coptis chinensis]|uniref:Cytochrome P450 n=1 Tax=Coptis chinensis TaxID=261450 RepID=A0A835HUH6_9MAGN|nr:hypothetical protein IFM89_036751 [Coptis chinensis]